MQVPTISVQPDGVTFRIMATSYGYTSAAGPRMFRAPPHPDIKFSGHPTVESADEAAVKMREYMAESYPKKVSRDKVRRHVD